MSQPYQKQHHVAFPSIIGNHVHFKQYASLEGLSQSTVLSILQDRQGFMWFGTEDGLNHYDGYHFTTYRHEPQNPHSLSFDQQIRSLCEDQNGLLWIGTGNGLNCYNPRSGLFSSYTHNLEQANSLSDNQILCIYEDQAGTLWIGTKGGGLNKFDPTTETFSHYLNDPDQAEGHKVRAIYEDKNARLWLGTEGTGLYKFNPATGQVEANYNTDNSTLSSDVIRSVYGAATDVLWLGTEEGGLNKFDPATATFTVYQHNPADPNSISGNDVVWVYGDRAGILWLGTFDAGVNEFNPATATFFHHAYDPYKFGGLNDRSVLSIYEDRSGVIWFGTERGGLNKFDRRRAQNFPHYTHFPHKANSLSDTRVMTIFEDHRGLLWIGTDNGLNKLDRSSGTFTHYLHDPQNPNSLPAKRVIYLYGDQNDMLWVGTDGGGLAKFDLKTEIFVKTYTADPDQPDAISDDFISVIYEDKAGTLWLGAAGLAKFNPDTESFTNYVADPADPTALSDDLITMIYEDRAGNLWIGTERGGFNKFDREQETFTTYRPDLKTNSEIWSIYEDETGLLWLGSNGTGLYKFEPSTAEFTQFSTADGLPNDIIYGILADKQGELWLSTNFGLSKFNPQTETCRNYDIRDGLQANEFQTGAYHQNKQGEMFFGGINGFNAFYPERVLTNSHIPAIVLTGFQITNQDVALKEPLAQIKALTLTHKDLVFSFEFAALDFTNTPKNQYSYKLEGFDDDWVEAGSRHFVTYTNIDSGPHTFRVKGSNNDGLWNEAGLTISITITPPGPDDIAIRRIDKLRRAVQEMAKALTTSIRMEQQDILQLMSHQTKDLIKTNKGYVVTYDKDNNLLQIPFMRESDSDDPTPNQPVEITDETTKDLLKRLLKDGEPTLIANVEDLYKKQNLPLQPESDLKSWLGVRLIIQDKILGGIALQHENVDAYQQDDKEILQIMTDLSAIAIQNFQLIEELDRKLAREKKLRQFVSGLSDTATSERINELLDEE